MKLVRRIRRALSGLIMVITSDTSVRSMVLIGIAVIACSFWLKLSRIELIVVMVIVFSVITLEGINTILERVIDLVEPRYKIMVREIKDGLAGLVLLSSIAAALVGIFIFWPYIIQKFT